MADDKDKSLLVNAREAARLLSVHKMTILRMANRGELPGFKMGRDWRFRRSDLEAWIDEQIRKQQGGSNGKD